MRLLQYLLVRSGNELKTNKDIRKALESTQIDDFMAYVHSPWRILWTNLMAGVFRGLGVAIGATAVLALLIWVLSLAKEIPFVGDYAAELTEQVSVFAEEARYSDDFERIQKVLERIEKDPQK